MNTKFLFGTCLVVTFTICSFAQKNSEPPNLVKSVEQQALVAEPSIAPYKNLSSSIQVTAVLDKKILFEQDFFYGADLQYSSIYDKKYDLYTQSVAQGHIPVHFRLAGDELQLIADNKSQFPSDVNHPEQLISRFKVLK